MFDSPATYRVVLLMTGLLVLVGCEKESASGTEAEHWLDNALANEWQQCPFPSGSVISVLAENEGAETKSYWFRVQFRPERAGEVIARFEGGLRLDGMSTAPISWQEPPRESTTMTGSTPPTFWKPDALGPARRHFLVVRYGMKDGHPRMGRSIAVWFSAGDGLAYIAVKQL